MPVKMAVIPVAGHGTRLLPLTKSIPKELLPLGGKPVLQHVVEELQAAGMRELAMVTSKSKDAIGRHFSRDTVLEEQLRIAGKEKELECLLFSAADSVFHYAEQEHQKGLGHAVLCAKDTVGDQSFMIALGDALIGDQYHGQSAASRKENKASLCGRMIDIFERSDADAVISFQRVAPEKVSRYGIAKLQPGYVEGDDAFNLAGLVEKPATYEAPSQYAVAARYLCKPVIFDYLERTPPGHGGEIQLTDAFQSLIDDGGKVLGVPLRNAEKRYDVGNFESYYAAFIELALADPEYGDSCRQLMVDLLRDNVKES